VREAALPLFSGSVAAERKLHPQQAEPPLPPYPAPGTQQQCWQKRKPFCFNFFHNYFPLAQEKLYAFIFCNFFCLCFSLCMCGMVFFTKCFCFCFFVLFWLQISHNYFVVLRNKKT